MVFMGGFEIMFTLVFIIVTGIFIFTLVSGVSTWNKNNNSPRLSVKARVVSKRMDETESAYECRRCYGSSWFSYNNFYHILCMFSSGKWGPYGTPC